MPAEQTGTKYLEGFNSLGNGLSYHKFAPTNSTLPDKSPSLVILATWFSALPRHVSKYVTTYKTLFPGAAILIIPTSIPEMVYLPGSTQQKNLAPALPILVEHAQQLSHEILLHVFSTAGAHTTCQLARAYRSHTGIALKVGALILDSAPGMNTYHSIYGGFVAGLPSTPVVKELLSVGIHGLLGLIALKEVITGEDHFILKLRKDLNDEGLFRSERGRVYIYSKEDKIIGWEDVESHAREAKGKDIGEVRTCIWQHSGHVGHMAKDAEKYWNVVRKLWDEEPTMKPRL